LIFGGLWQRSKPPDLIGRIASATCTVEMGVSLRFRYYPAQKRPKFVLSLDIRPEISSPSPSHALSSLNASEPITAAEVISTRGYAARSHAEDCVPARLEAMETANALLTRLKRRIEGVLSGRVMTRFVPRQWIKRT
jgi:hypothetical protein